MSNSIKVVALIDRPSHHSYAMLGFIARDLETGTLHTKGVATEKFPKQMSDRLVEEMRQNLLLVEHLNVVVSEQPKLVCGWLGERFVVTHQLCSNAPLLVKPNPDTVYLVKSGESEGYFWVTQSDQLHGQMISFAEESARAAIRENERRQAGELAWLASMTIPQNELVSVAKWWTAGSDNVRNQFLQFYVQCGAVPTQDDFDTKKKKLAVRYQQIVDGIRS